MLTWESKRSIFKLEKLVKSKSRSIYTNTSELRRSMRRRKYLARPENVDDILVVPRERLGVDVKLNLALNKNHSLTPNNYAFDNLHLQQLVMLAEGKLDASKALHVESDNLSDHRIYYVPPKFNKKFTPPQGANLISEETFSKLGRYISDQIGESDNVFVEDGSLGSHRLGEHRVRIITNSPVVGIMGKHLLTKQPPREAYTFENDSTYYCCPTLDADVHTQFGLKSSSFTVVNLDRAVVLSGGISSSRALRIGLATVAGGRFINDDIPTLPLSSHIWANEEGKVSLVIDPNNILVRPNSRKNLVAFSGALWNHYGTYRMWDGITHSDLRAVRTRGDLVEKIRGSNNSYVTQRLSNNLPNILDQPTSVIILVRDSTGVLPGVARLTPEAAIAYLNSGYNGNPKDSSPFYLPYPIVQQGPTTDNLFKELLELSNASVYIVNVKRKDGTEFTNAEIDVIIDGTLNGSLQKEKGTDDPVLRCSVIKSVKGVKTSLDPLHGWSQKDYQEKAKELSKTLGLGK